MRRTKTRAGRSGAVAASSSSSEEKKCKFVKVLVFFKKNYNIIYEVITIEFISFIFRFTNIEVARVISSAFKSSMEIPLFQWSQISKHPEWMPQINAWFNRFEVGINL